MDGPETKTAIKYPHLDPRYIFINSGFNYVLQIFRSIGLNQFKRLKIHEDKSK